MACPHDRYGNVQAGCDEKRERAALLPRMRREGGPALPGNARPPATHPDLRADRNEEPCGMAGRHPFSRRLDTDPLPRSIPSDRDRWRGGVPPIAPAGRNTGGSESQLERAGTSQVGAARFAYASPTSLAEGQLACALSTQGEGFGHRQAPLLRNPHTRAPPFRNPRTRCARLFGWVFRSPSVRRRSCRKIVRKWTRNRALARKGGVWKPL